MRAFILGRFSVILLTISFGISGVHAASNMPGGVGQHDLLDHLFDAQRYNRRVRPVLSAKDSVNVTFGLVVKEIENLDDKNQILITRAEIRESWYDPLLTWNPSNYGGVMFISVSSSQIWIPDVVLYNNAGEGFGSGKTRTKAFISHEGLISLNVPTIIKSSCKIQVDNYPFDQQNCDLKFGSWTYDASGISLTLEKPTADVIDYSPSVAWELIGVPGEFHSILYTCCPRPYHDVTYTVRIKRRALYYAMYLIIPCAMISVLTLLVFILPPDCNERMTVGMAILVGLSFFFLLVAENMPATSEAVPLVGVYYTVTMIEVSCAFFMTCWVLRFHHHNPTEGPVPDWVRVYLLGYGARIFRFDFKDSGLKQPPSSVNDNQGSSMESIPPTTVHDQKQFLKKKAMDNKQLPTSENPPEEQIKKRSANSILAENIRHQLVLEARQEEWRKAALVLNHIFIWLFIFAVVVSFLAIFLRAPL